MQQELFNSDSENGMIRNLLPKDGVVEVYPGFFNASESEQLFNHLLQNIAWKQDSMKFYGKTVNLPRLTAWYGESMKSYSYSGIDMNANPWTEELLFIKNRLEQNSGIKFTSVLLNLYRNGN